MTRMRLGFVCPHCDQRGRHWSTTPLSRTVHELRYICSNADCGHIFAVRLEAVRSVRRSARPHPDVTLPIRESYHWRSRPPEPTAQDMPAIGMERRRNAPIACAHCGAACASFKMQYMSSTTMTLGYDCTNAACGHRFIAVAEAIRTISPPAVPRTGVRLALDARIDRTGLVEALLTLPSAELLASGTTAPTDTTVETAPDERTSSALGPHTRAASPPFATATGTPLRLPA